MRHFPMPALLAAVAWTAMQAAAVAATASQTFTDVPPGHWAEQAVTQVAVERAFMTGLSDGTFRGEQPFTRLQLAVAVAELIKELETLSHASWASDGLGGYAFQDLPADPRSRAIALRMANGYRLFEGVPGVTSQTLESDKQVTRYEMAKVIHRLMRLGEAKGLVDPAVQRPQIRLFTDVPATAWAYQSVKEVTERYQVMVGFPDATFRGPEELTRYQFAASAAQTFPMVRALVARTQEQKDQPTGASAAAWRFQEQTPWHLGLLARLNGPVGPAIAGRYAHYVGPLFALADAQLGLQNAGLERLYQLGLGVGYAIPLGSTVHLQPYVGGRVITSGADTVGGFSYGVVGYHRPSETWGLFSQLQGVSALGGTATGAPGAFLGSATLGAEYHVSPRLGFTAEAGYGMLPSALGAVALPTEGAALGTVGVLFAF